MVAGMVADIGAKLGELSVPGPVLVLIGRVFADVGAQHAATDDRAPISARATDRL